MTTKPRFILALLAGALATMALAGCAGTQGRPTTPRSRVAQDLGCTPEGTTVQEIERTPDEKGARWQVRGCGRTAVYMCTLPVRDCWREGEILKDPAVVTPQ